MSMRKEDKELLLHDLCARLPYGVKASCTEISTKSSYDIEGVCVYDRNVPIVHLRNQGIINMPILYVKPYLFPLSSMTEEEKKEYISITQVSNHSIAIDFLNKYHFDYRGLIPKGLANDASGLNIY